MSSKHTLIAAIAGAFGTGLGWMNRKPKTPEIDAQPIRPYRAERIAADPRTRKAVAADRRARRNAKRLENARRQREGMEP